MTPMSPSMIGQQAVTLPELYKEELPAILRNAVALPAGIRRVYALGNGDSHHAALAAAQAFARWTDVEYLPMPAYQFYTHEIDRMHSERAHETLVVCISASGSSKLAVNIFNAVQEKHLAHTLSMTGKPGCLMDQTAQYALSVAIREKGRSPGIRTYAASLCGLLRLACALGGDDELQNTLAAQLETSALQLPALLETSCAIAQRAAQWDWPLTSVVGCDGLRACAQFTAAKFAEGCGVFALSDDLEEWCHVESMTYPLHVPVIIFQGTEAEKAQAIKVAGTAHRAGRKVILIAAGDEDPSLREAADESIFLRLNCDASLLPLYHYIPSLYLVQALAEKLGRAMFLSDQPFSLF